MNPRRPPARTSTALLALLALGLCLPLGEAAARPASHDPITHPFDYPAPLIEFSGLDPGAAPDLARALVGLIARVGDDPPPAALPAPSGDDPPPAALPPPHGFGATTLGPGLRAVRRPVAAKREPPRGRPAAGLRAFRALDALRARAAWRRGWLVDARARIARETLPDGRGAEVLRPLPPPAADAAFDEVLRALGAVTYAEESLTAIAFVEQPTVRRAWALIDGDGSTPLGTATVHGQHLALHWWALALERLLVRQSRADRRVQGRFREMLYDWPARRPLTDEPRWLAEAILAHLRHQRLWLSEEHARPTVAALLRAARRAPPSWRTGLRRTLRATLRRMDAAALPPLMPVDAPLVAAALTGISSAARFVPAVRAQGLELDPTTDALLDWLAGEGAAAEDPALRILGDLARWPAPGEARPADLPGAPIPVPAPPGGRQRLIWLDDQGGVAAVLAVPADARLVPLPGGAAIGRGAVERVSLDPDGRIERRPLPEPLAGALLDGAVRAGLDPAHARGIRAEPWPRPPPAIMAPTCATGVLDPDPQVARRTNMMLACHADLPDGFGALGDPNAFAALGEHYWCGARLWRLDGRSGLAVADLSPTPTLVARPGSIRAAVGPGALAVIDAASGAVRHHRFDP